MAKPWTSALGQASLERESEENLKNSRTGVLRAGNNPACLPAFAHPMTDSTCPSRCGKPASKLRKFPENPLNHCFYCWLADIYGDSGMLTSPKCFHRMTGATSTAIGVPEQARSWRRLSVPAKLFITLVVTSGLGTLIYGGIHQNS